MQMGQTGDRTADLQVGGRPLYPSATATPQQLAQPNGVTDSFALSCAIAKMLTLFSPFPRQALTNGGGERGQVACSHHTSAWPHPSKERGGQEPRGRRQARLILADCVASVGDLHMGSEGAPTTAAVSR
ncbi:unnamed protein product [Pleuronectes platessa]|uniref:Uncharacterized protein n=1 Tax=Pleuronectes platessa TaxID=8262 RepID=A0A9N7UMB4_PLEPL|nr:unnamed protein product [Pleuronectes platessa]